MRGTGCQIPPPDPPRRENLLLQVKTVELIYYRYASVATNAFPLDDLYIDGKWDLSRNPQGAEMHANR